MSRFAKLFAANAIAAAGLGCAALALSPAATAEPIVPPGIPDVPALNMLQQFATNPASVGAVLQTAATALNGASSVVGGAPATLPVSPIEGVPTAPPAAVPTAPSAAVPTAPSAAVPVAPATDPIGLGSTLVPLLNQLGVPASLANLTPAIAPAAVPAAVPAAIPAPLAGSAPAGVVMPLSALSALP